MPDEGRYSPLVFVIVLGGWFGAILAGALAFGWLGAVGVWIVAPFVVIVGVALGEALHYRVGRRRSMRHHPAGRNL